MARICMGCGTSYEPRCIGGGYSYCSRACYTNPARRRSRTYFSNPVRSAIFDYAERLVAETAPAWLFAETRREIAQDIVIEASRGEFRWPPSRGVVAAQIRRWLRDHNVHKYQLRSLNAPIGDDGYTLGDRIGVT